MTVPGSSCIFVGSNKSEKNMLYISHYIYHLLWPMFWNMFWKQMRDYLCNQGYVSPRFVAEIPWYQPADPSREISSHDR